MKLLSTILVLAIGVIILFATGCTSSRALSQPVPIIFDTDMGTDVDDAGALAILHVMADRGQAEILATISANRSRWSAPAIDVINTYYGRPDIPIGSSRTGPNPEMWYHDSVPGFRHDLKNGDDAPEAIGLYRKILTNQPDKSVTIVTVGWLTNMADLLDSGPDQYSPLNGKELIESKVKCLVSMGGLWPNSKQEGEYNFHMDGKAAQKVISDWPGKIVFTGLGKDVMTASRLIKETPDSNPVKTFYNNFFKGYDGYKGPDGIERSSWDLIAVLYAVQGPSDYFTVVSDGYAIADQKGSTQWISGDAKDHSYLAYKMPPEELAKVIDELLIVPPKRISN